MPQRRTSTLSSALLPTGTLSCGVLGSASSSGVRSSSSVASCASSALISSARCLFSASSADASCARTLGLRNLLADAVAFGLQVLHARQQFAPECVEFLQTIEHGVGGGASRLEAAAGLVEGVPELGGVEHAAAHCTDSARPSGARNRVLPCTHAFPDVKGVCVKLSVRTAVFPAAGLGTRFLPATKTMPKEMLPLVDKPIIQYAVEEAVAAGIDQIVMVTARGKTAMIDHFDIDVELETFLEERGKLDQLAAVRHVSSLARLGAVRQGRRSGSDTRSASRVTWSATSPSPSSSATMSSTRRRRPSAR